MDPINLKWVLKPKSVAIIGASRNPEKVGRVILENYINTGYSGKLYPVNKEADKIMGLKAYKSVRDIKGKVDLAVIAIPAQAVPEVLEERGKKNIKGAIVISGGFSEVGNIQLQQQITEIAKKYNISMLGPNCLGVEDTRSRVNTMFLPTYKLSEPKIGYVSFMSQSGAVGSTVLDVISGEGFGLSKFISYGNAAYIDETHILKYLMKDKETKIIVAYIEGIKNPKGFIEIAKKVTKVKPVIILKAGRTQAGVTAAHSHTAALAGNYAVQEAIFKQYGFTIAQDLDDLITYAKIFNAGVEPKGNRVAVITNGGGTGVLTADAIAESHYLQLAQYSEETKNALKSVLPDYVNIASPLDLGGDADAKRFEGAVSVLGKDPAVDMLIVITLFQTPGADSTVSAELIRQKKPIAVISAGAAYTQMQKMMMESGGVPVYESPAAAVKALTALLKYANYKNRKHTQAIA